MGSHIWITIVLALVLLIALVYAVSYYAYRRTFSAKCLKTPLDLLDGDNLDNQQLATKKLIEDFMKISYKDVSIESKDGLMLYGRYYHVRDGAPLEIQFHGYRSHAMRDFAGGAMECLRSGYNLLLVDQRAHGMSEGRSITFGAKERWDVVSWVNYAVNRFGEDVKIILCGVSMGAATVLMASELDLPSNVKCILADCPFSSPKEIIQKVLKDMHAPVRLIYPFVRFGAITFAGFDPNSVSAKEAVKNTDIPILLMHGEADEFVPCQMGIDISRAGETVKLFTFPGADHGLSFVTDRERYMRIVNKFYEMCLDD